MLTLYICRHGQTENNKNNRLSGWIDTPLTKQGIQNAHDAAAKLQGTPFDKIVSSDLGRAFTTAYIISRDLGYSAEIERQHGLREINYGAIANMLIPEAIAAYPDMDNVNPTGENGVQMQQRVMVCLRQLAQDNDGGTVVVVAHDGTINALYASFANEDMLETMANRYNGHDFVAKLTYDNGTIISFDEVA